LKRKERAINDNIAIGIPNSKDKIIITVCTITGCILEVSIPYKGRFLVIDFRTRIVKIDGPIKHEDITI
jgi:hypothetical protein